jgi:hypothetical protein
MLALYFKCMMMNLALPSLFTLSLIALLLLCMHISVYMCWALRCMCWDGNSGSWRAWGKAGRRRRFGYFWAGWARNNWSGIGDRVVLLTVSLLYGFWSIGVGVLLTLGGHELASVWNQVGQPLHRTFRTHHLAESGVRAMLSSVSAEPYLPIG